MNQNYTKLIDSNDEFGKDSSLVHLSKVERLKDTLNGDFDMWSNFDTWESITVQRWIFARALDVYRGKKIYIECECCKYIYSIPSNFENIRSEKCYGKKSAYMIKKVVDEIIIAKSIRETDGTYSS